MSDYTPSTASIVRPGTTYPTRLEYLRELNCATHVILECVKAFVEPAADAQPGVVPCACQIKDCEGLVDGGSIVLGTREEMEKQILDAITGGADEFSVLFHQGTKRAGVLFFVLGNGADCVLGDSTSLVSDLAFAAQESWADDASCKANDEI